jgi:hypothetical protein
MGGVLLLFYLKGAKAIIEERMSVCTRQYAQVGCWVQRSVYVQRHSISIVDKELINSPRRGDQVYRKYRGYFFA